MKTTQDSVQAVHDLIATATYKHATPIEAMQITQAALNVANALQGLQNVRGVAAPPDFRD